MRIDGESPVAMASGLVDVMPPAMLHPLPSLLVHRAYDSRRRADDERSGGDLHILQQQGTRTDHRAAPDPDAIQEDRTHSDQAIVLDGATVQDDPMADGHPVPDGARNSRVGV